MTHFRRDPQKSLLSHFSVTFIVSGFWGFYQANKNTMLWGMGPGAQESGNWVGNFLAWETGQTWENPKIAPENWKGAKGIPTKGIGKKY